MVFQYKIKDINADKVYQGVAMAETARAIVDDIGREWDLEDIDNPVQIMIVPVSTSKNITWKELQTLDWDEEERPAPSKPDSVKRAEALARHTAQNMVDKAIAKRFLEMSIPSNSPWILDDEEDEDDE